MVKLVLFETFDLDIWNNSEEVNVCRKQWNLYRQL